MLFLKSSSNTFIDRNTTAFNPHMNVHSLTDIDFHPEEIMLSLNKLSASSAPCPEGISSFLLTKCSSAIAHLLPVIFRSSLISFTFRKIGLPIMSHISLKRAISWMRVIIALFYSLVSCKLQFKAI